MARRGVLVQKMGGICAFWGVFSGKVADGVLCSKATDNR